MSALTVWHPDKPIGPEEEDSEDLMKVFDKKRNLEKASQNTDFYCSVTQPCPTLCNTMDHSMPGFPILHRGPELAQTHVH